MNHDQMKSHSRSSGVTKDQPSVENDLELKAHIYQQLVDLQPYLSPESQIAVLVQQESDGITPDEHVMTLVATLGEFRLESEGRDENIYEAFGIAKRNMIHQLEEWYAASIDSTDRDEMIQSFIEKRHLVH